MAKKYKGSLSLEWYNKQKSILVRSQEDIKMDSDVPAPKINWINKEDALFYEIDDEEGKGLTPYWVDRNDIRVKEARPLLLQKTYKAIQKDVKGTLHDTAKEWMIEEGTEEDPSIDNILIKGDNLLALNTLKKMFDNKEEEEKVKCIYIDPPYNTGSAFDKYEDNLAHSEWLTLMRDRLILLKSLLRNDGVICIHLDNEESAYLKILLDEIFGRSNYVDSVTVVNNPRGRDYGGIANMHEIIHIYKNSMDSTLFDLVQKDKKFPFTDDISGYEIRELRNRNTKFHKDNRPNLFYPFYVNPTNQIDNGFFEISLEEKEGFIKVNPAISQGIQTVWRWGKEKSLENLNINIVGRKMTTTDGWQIVEKYRKNTQMARSVWHDKLVNSERGTLHLKKLFKSKVFDYPKPEETVSRILEITSEEGDVILDCFGGSGTTFTTATKMNRKWIGVEIGEQADEIIIPRLNIVQNGLDAGGITKDFNWQGGGSFKYYHLGESIITLNQDGTGDFNWKLGRKYIEEAFLSSYDYIIDESLDLSNGYIFPDGHTPIIGVQEVGTKRRVAIISLNAPDESNEFMTYDEIFHLYQQVKRHFNPQYINVFTNRGVEIAYESKPDDLEVIKVPKAIFSELEK